MASTSSRKDGGAGEAALIPLGSHAGSPPIPIKRPATLFGSRKDAVRVHLESSTVSKVHCVLVRNDWGCYIHDLGSRTHTLVNGKVVVDANLKDGDQIQIGRFQFKFSYKPADGDDEQLIAPPAQLDVSTLSDPVPLSKRVLVIGRRENADLHLDDRAVSNIHAIIFEHNGQRVIRDISSRTGTWLDGKPVHQEPLKPGLTVKIGPAVLTYTLALPGAAAAVDLRDELSAPIALAEATGAKAEAPIEIDAPADGPVTDADLDDLLGLELADETRAATSLPPIELEPEPTPSKESAGQPGEDDGLASLRRDWRGSGSGREPVEETSKAATPVETPADESPAGPSVRDELDLELLDAPAESPAPAVGLDDLDIVVPESADRPADTDIMPALAADAKPVEADAESPAPTPEPEVEPEPAHERAVPEPTIEPAPESIALEPIALESDEPETPDAIALEGESRPEPSASEPAAPEADVEASESADEPEAIGLTSASEARSVVEAASANEAPALDDVSSDEPALELESIEREPAADESAEAVAETPAPEAEAITSDAAPEAPAADVESPDVAVDVADEPELSLDDDRSVETPAAEAEAKAPVAETPVIEPPAAEASAAEAETPVAESTPVESGPSADESTSEIAAELGAIVAEPVDEAAAADEIGESISADVSEPATPVAEALEPEVDLSALDAGSDVDAEVVDETVADIASPAAESMPAIDLSAARFDESADADEEDEPTPIAELARIDFSTLDLTTAEPSSDAPADEDEHVSLVGEIHDESETARPLIHLADSVAGITAEAELEDESPAEPQLDIEAETIDAEVETDAGIDTTPAERIEIDLDLSTPATTPAVGPVAEVSPVVDADASADEIDLSDLDAPAAPAPSSIVSSAEDRDDVDAIEEDESPETSFESAVANESIEAPEADPPVEVGGIQFDADGMPIAYEMPAVETPADRAGEDASLEDTDLEIPPPSGGTLEDLIPADGPLIGGSFATPDPAMLVGGSPVVVPEPPEGAVPADVPPPMAPPPPPRRKPLRVGFDGRSGPAASPFAGTERTIADVLIGRRASESVDVFANPSPTPEDLLLAQSEHQVDRPAPSAEAPAASTSSADTPIDAPKADAPVADSPIPDSPISGAAFTDVSAPDPAAPQSDANAGLPVDLTDEEALGRALTREEREIMEVARQFRPRRPIRPVSQPAPVIPPVYRPGDDPESHAAARRRRISRVFLLLGLIVTLIPAALLAIYWYVPAQTRIESVITFSGLDAQSAEGIRQFRDVQTSILFSETTRQDAATLLRGIPFGFLDSGEQMIRRIDREKLWPANQPAQMKLVILSQGDKENDRARLHALAQAVINASQAERTRLDQLRESVASSTSDLNNLHSRLKSIKAEQLELQQIGEKRVTPEEMRALEVQRQQAEDELRAVKSNRQELEATIDRLQRTELVPAAGSAATPADLAQADAELTKLNQQLAELQKQRDAIKSAVDEKAAEARKQLDALIAQFDADLQTAQKLKDNPELQQYVEAVNRLFKQTRELTEELIRSQEKQRTKLSEWKQNLSDKIAARTKELLEKDEKLKSWNDALAMAERKLNAARAEGAGTPDELANLEKEIEFTRTLIRAREEQYNNDPIFQETVAGLQELIDFTEQSIKSDRKRVDAMLAQAQEEFTRTAPAVEKLPAEQKALAEALDKKLAAVTEARKAYDAASDAAQAEQAKLEASLKEKMLALEVEISSRRAALAAAAEQKQFETADAARKQQIAETQTQLTNVRQQEAQAQAKLDGTIKAIQDAVAINNAFRASELRASQLSIERNEVETKIKQITGWLGDWQKEMARLIVPETRPETDTHDLPDHRPLYMTIAGGGLLALLLVPLCWNLVLLSRDAHHATPAIPIGGGTLAALTASPALSTAAVEEGAEADQAARDSNAVHTVDQAGDTDAVPPRVNGFEPIMPTDAEPALAHSAGTNTDDANSAASDQRN